MTPGRSPLTHRQRQRGIVVQMASNSCSWGGFLLLIPLAALHYVDSIGWQAGTFGLMRAVRQVAQQGLSAFVGVWRDRIDPKPLICTGQPGSQALPSRRRRRRC